MNYHVKVSRRVAPAPPRFARSFRRLQEYKPQVRERGRVSVIRIHHFRRGGQLAVRVGVISAVEGAPNVSSLSVKMRRRSLRKVFQAKRVHRHCFFPGYVIFLPFLPARTAWLFPPGGKCTEFLATNELSKLGRLRANSLPAFCVRLETVPASAPEALDKEGMSE